MIIRFFKTSYFSSLLALSLLVLVLWIPESTIFPTYVSSWPTSYLPLSPWIQQILSIILFFLTALLINQMATKHRLADRNSYLVAFFFILIGSASGFLTQMSPFLLATFFFAFFFRKVFDFQSSTKLITTSFDAGLFLGITSLFFPPAALLVLFAWFALLVYQADQWRAYVTVVLGILLPWFFVFSGYFWFNKLPEALSGFVQYFHFREIVNPFAGNLDLMVFLLVALIILTGAFSILSSLSSFNINLRQHASVSLWGLLFCLLIVFLFAAPIQVLTLTALPASLIVGAFFSRMKRLKWANLFVLLWILFIFINHFLPLFYAA
jgi:hypothetical protein